MLKQFEEAVKLAIHRVGILNRPLEILHLSNGLTAFNPHHGEDDIEYARGESPVGRYFVRNNRCGVELLEDLSSDVDMSKRKCYKGIIQPGIRLGFTRSMWRIDSGPKPSIWDLYWNYQSPDNTELLKSISNDYGQSLRKELAKHCDLLVMTNSAWIREWAELIQLTDFPIDWK